MALKAFLGEPWTVELREESDRLYWDAACQSLQVCVVGHETVRVSVSVALSPDW